MIYNNQNSAIMLNNDLPKELPFIIRTIRELRGEGETAAHRHAHFELLCVFKGGGSLRLDLQQLTLENHRVYCIAPGQVHQFLPDEHAEGFCLAFSESFPDNGEYDPDIRSLQLMKKAGGIPVNGDVLEDLVVIMNKLCQEFNNLYPFKLQVIKRYLRILLIYLSRHLSEDKPMIQQTRDKELVQDFIELVEKHFKEIKMVTDYAGRLSITPNYLNEIVKKNTGYPAGHHIRQRVVLEAKRMGLYTRTNMKQIAYSLGFSDCGHFSKFFKSATGKNFSDFKREKMMMAVA
jgi:AraC family transcriptional activator of pobA